MKTRRSLSVRVLLSVAVALCTVGPVAAQQLVVSDSIAQAEVLLPELGWRRAVLGRAIPTGSVVTTWIDSEVALEQQGVELRLVSLGHLIVESTTEDALDLRLTAGTLQVDTADISLRIVLTSRGHTVTTEGARFLIDTRRIVIQTGNVRVDLADVPIPIELSDGAEFSFVLQNPEAIFPISSAY